MNKMNFKQKKLGVLNKGSLSIEWICVSLGISLIVFAPIFDGKSSTEILIESINSNYINNQNVSRFP